MQNHATANRKYKDRLFVFIFHEKKALLSLYNAINGSDYSDSDELEIYTMEDFIYMGMKNDLSFLIDSQLAVFEHQSSYNPNMPLRGFIYMADALKKYIALNCLDLYSSRRLDLPTLRYYVFYNGTRGMEDETVLYLTESMGKDAAEKSCAEFKAQMININEGHSLEIMKKCPQLYEYSYFVSRVRKYIAGGNSLLDAINSAVDECIEKGILADVLRAHRAEVTDMLLKEYDEAFHISCEKKISYEDGYEDGVEQEKARTEEANQRADKADQRAEESNRRAEEADRRAEEASRRADEAMRKAEILIRRFRGCSEEEIAADLNIGIETVRECVRELMSSK